MTPMIDRNPQAMTLCARARPYTSMRMLLMVNTNGRRNIPTLAVTGNPAILAMGKVLLPMTSERMMEKI